MIGEFEYLVLTAVARLGEDAYGASIRRLLAEVGREPSVGALYTTLDRMEEKALLRSWMGEATAERGGRAKRMVRLTPKGALAASSFYHAVTEVSRGVAWAK